MKRVVATLISAALATTITLAAHDGHGNGDHKCEGGKLCENCKKHAKAAKSDKAARSDKAAKGDARPAAAADAKK